MFRILILALKLLISGLVFYLVVREVDFSLVLSQLIDIEIWAVVLALVLTVTQVMVGAVRWWTIFQGLLVQVGVGRILLIYYIGVFFNMFFPGGVTGDFVKMWYANSREIDAGSAINSVLLDRILTVAWLVGLVLIGFMINGQSTESSFARLEETVYAFSVLTVGGIGFLMVLDRLPVKWRRFAMFRGLAKLAEDTRRIFFSVRVFAGVSALSLLGNLIQVLVVYVVALGLGFTPSFLEFVIFVPPVLFLSFLPISVGGWGVREGAMVISLGFLGFAPEIALSLSVSFGVLGLLGSLPGGVLWLMRKERVTG